MVNVLDSVLGVSKGLSEAGEVGVVILWRRDDLQQPGLHLLGKTTKKNNSSLSSKYLTPQLSDGKYDFGDEYFSEC